MKEEISSKNLIIKILAENTYNSGVGQLHTANRQNKRSALRPKNLNRRPPVVININPENQHNFQKVKHHAVHDDNFNLTNLVKSNTCFTKNNKSTIDLLLTNNPMSFQVTNTTETELSDCHKLISSFMKSYISLLKPKTIFYRNYKNFDEEKFVTDVKAADFSFSNNDPNENYSVLSDTFSKLVDRHAPLKMKI